MGTFKGGSPAYRGIASNLPALQSKYDYSNGYFGKKGQGGTSTRNITSNNPLKAAKEFYDQSTFGGIERILNNGKGVRTDMADGTIITYRERSSSDGSPAVDINIRKSLDSGGIKEQKIHFVKGK